MDEKTEDAGRESTSSPLDWLERIDKIHEPGYMNWITCSWAAMFIQQKIIPADGVSKVARAALKMWDQPVTKDEAGPHTYGADRYFIETAGEEAGGRVMMARTQPSMRQMLEVRHQLMKQMCRIYDMLHATLDLAAQHTDAIMPGYTHSRHAQPTTFGHYLLSVFDAIARSAETLERGYHLMSLNEMGCGALAGTSWPIDRELVSEYLGMEGLIENANDAVSYADGYVVVVCGLTNVAVVASRAAMDLSIWSGAEYGFLEIGGIRGRSFMMPQKSNNPNGFEQVRVAAGQILGHLTGVAAAGLRAPHADVFEMLYMAEPTLAALNAMEWCATRFAAEIRGLKVNRKRMLEVIRESYICATELANQLVRDYRMSYRTAHEIVNKFVLASEERGIPATEASSELLDAAAREVVGRPLDMSDERLRELLDPAYFIRVTNSQGGVAPEETARMVADRGEKLAAACDRHRRRIETLETAQQKMLADLRGFCKG